MRTAIIGLNLMLLVAFPLSWFAPLLRAGLLPLFGLSEISVITGLQSLWDSDPVLALIVTFMAVFVPILKSLGLALVHFRLLAPGLVPVLVPVLGWLGRLAMAEVFLIAPYIVVVKGVGMATVEVAWGLYLFAACVILSILIAALTERA